MDFVHDQLATGQKLRVLTIVDTFSRFSPHDIRAQRLVNKWFEQPLRPKEEQH